MEKTNNNSNNGVIDNGLIFACREIVIYIMIYNIFLTQSPESLTIYGERGEGQKETGRLEPFFVLQNISCECFSIVVGESCFRSKGEIITKT